MECGDATSLQPITKGRPVAGIFSGFGLQQIPRPAQALRDWAGVLAPGGALVVAYWPHIVEERGPWRCLTDLTVGSENWQGGIPDVALAALPGLELVSDTEPAFEMVWPGAAEFFEVRGWYVGYLFGSGLVVGVKLPRSERVAWGCMSVLGQTPPRLTLSPSLAGRSCPRRGPGALGASTTATPTWKRSVKSSWPAARMWRPGLSGTAPRPVKSCCACAIQLSMPPSFEHKVFRDAISVLWLQIVSEPVRKFSAILPANFISSFGLCR